MLTLTLLLATLNVSKPLIPTENHPLMLKYGNSGQSKIGKHGGYGFRLNHGDAAPAPISKHW